MPEDFELGVVYICHDFDLLALSCPCECGAKIHLPTGRKLTGGSTAAWTKTSHKHGPRWEFNEQTKTVTPSIQYLGECHSHFYIRDGDIVWC
jgi:hypothetical protein